MKSEIEQRMKNIQEREQNLNIKDQSLKRSLKTDEFFNEGTKNEYSDIIQELRSIDTRGEGLASLGQPWQNQNTQEDPFSSRVTSNHTQTFVPTTSVNTQTHP